LTSTAFFTCGTARTADREQAPVVCWEYFFLIAVAGIARRLKSFQ
jgi:hypothetical protein